jgi:hypothetical protein
VVYGFEGVDNQGNPRVALGATPDFTAQYRSSLLGGIMVLRGEAANGQTIQAIPFYALANRGKSVQEVWVEQQGLKVTDEWWLGALYRSMRQK